MPGKKKGPSGAQVCEPPKKADGAPVGLSACSPGDKIRVSCPGAEYTGVVLPASDNGGGFLPLKLESGYNVGIRKESISAVWLVSKGNAAPGKTDKMPAQPANKGGAHKNHVSILTCGGTISSKIDYRSGAVYPATTPQELLEGFPFAKGMNARPRMLFSLLSEDMSPEHWAKIAEAAAEEINRGAEGLVVTHGTDTMHYTSSALSFMLQNLPCPVVLTGSQRSSDRGSSDAAVNMHSSLIAARADLSGVFVCMHENPSDDSCLLHFGTRARKMHTTRRDAFQSIGCSPAARVFPSQGKVEKLSKSCMPRDPSKKLILDARCSSNVAMVYSYPGLKPEMISKLSDYDGVVAVGTGIGHLPANCRSDSFATSVVPAVKGLVDSGVAVVMASQTIHGRINMDVYATGRALREIGVIGHLCDMSPETAYAKLCWVLGHEKKPQKVRALMEADIAGEITARSEITDGA
ncbi:MAG: Glu-tRNA(Gln) amidotransferase subunit GatD [Candidatus Micrarchaeia archaeon]